MPTRWIRWTTTFVMLVAASWVPSTCHSQGLTQADIDKAMATTLPADPAAVVAVVGESQILYGDVKSRVDARIKDVLASTKQEIPEEQLHFARVNLTRGLLAQAIQNKSMREMFLISQVGTQAADKREEAASVMASRARQLFHETEVPDLVEKYKAKDLVELNDKLRETGSSVAARERDFMDAMLGHMYLRGAVDNDPEITVAEINNYFLRNRKDYARKAQARWEQLSVLFENHSAEEAEKLIREIYQEALYGGNLQAVARKRSEEPFASDGGLHEWTNKGSLASAELNQQIFAIPLNKMSAIIKDSTGLHIVRVLQRRPAGIAPLSTVQEEIRENLKKAKVAKSRKKAMAELQKRIPVWTIFPEDVSGSKPLRAPQIATPGFRNF